MDDFYAFILMIASNQYSENTKFEQEKVKAKKEGKKSGKATKLLDLNYDLLVSAFKNVIQSQARGGSGKQSALLINETTIL